jgi:hypothetical protein
MDTISRLVDRLTTLTRHLVDNENSTLIVESTREKNAENIGRELLDCRRELFAELKKLREKAKRWDALKKHGQLEQAHLDYSTVRYSIEFDISKVDLSMRKAVDRLIKEHETKESTE